ncbi:MAG TPA: hypothetical protein DEP60_03910 [Ruminococcaceae bacterium]|jgi:hypothetical protein|nr:hypothetical protein [Oscillospiraceae bacterium]
MKAKRHFLHLMAVAFCALLVCFWLPIQTYAASDDSADLSKVCSMTVNCQDGGQILKEVPVRIYRVAAVEKNGSFEYAGPFSTYQDKIKINGLSAASEWDASAATLSEYVAADGKPVTASQLSGNDGKAVFNNLQSGLYLVLLEHSMSGSTTYQFHPFLISLPNYDSQTHTWDYHVTVNPKGNSAAASEPVYPPSQDSFPENSHGNPPSNWHYKVIKHWTDSGHDAKRPLRITIDILQNGKLLDTQVLSDQNNWTYEWSSEDSSAQWTVVERSIPNPYQVTIETTNSTDTTSYVITNTWPGSSSGPQREPSVPPNHYHQDDTSVPIGTVRSSAGQRSSAVSGSNLPQTGQLWWPVPLLAASGIVLFSIGWLMNKKRKG